MMPKFIIRIHFNQLNSIKISLITIQTKSKQQANMSQQKVK